MHQFKGAGRDFSELFGSKVGFRTLNGLHIFVALDDILDSHT